MPLPAIVARTLRAHRAAQAQQRLKAGAAYGDLDLLFAIPLGEPLDLRNVVKRALKPPVGSRELT